MNESWLPLLLENFDRRCERGDGEGIKYVPSIHSSIHPCKQERKKELSEFIERCGSGKGKERKGKERKGWESVFLSFL